MLKNIALSELLGTSVEWRALSYWSTCSLNSTLYTPFWTFKNPNTFVLETCNFEMKGKVASVRNNYSLKYFYSCWICKLRAVFSLAYIIKIPKVTIKKCMCISLHIGQKWITNKVCSQLHHSNINMFLCLTLALSLLYLDHKCLYSFLDHKCLKAKIILSS